MCGITGVVGLNAGSPEVRQRVQDALVQIRHRGPDRDGFITEEVSWTSVTVGQARLSGVGRQASLVPYTYPYAYPNLGIVLAYDGRIYNHGELRHALSDGTPWETGCDADVLARAWRRWGPECLDQLNGMFAFCVIDTEENAIFLVRDRAGEKPLYWTVRDDHLYFASEIKGLAVEGSLEETDCLDLEVFEYDCRVPTPFKGVYTLRPGHYLRIDHLLRTDRTWWTLPAEVDESMSWNEACARTEALVVSAIRMRTQTELPLTVYLSGGLDSAILQRVVKAPQVFCYTAPGEGIDNVPMAREAANGAEVVPVQISLKETEALLSRIAWHADTPCTCSAVAQWALACQAKTRGFSVVLSGEGADELFGGHARYRVLWWLDRLYADPALAAYGPLIERAVDTVEKDIYLQRLVYRGRFDESSLFHVRGLVGEFDDEDSSLVERAWRFDFRNSMQVLLRMADRMTAAWGLENRSPFLDHRLIELAARMPVTNKITDGYLKSVLTGVARRLGVPDVIIDHKTKSGLLVPWNVWTGRPGSIDRSSFSDAMKAAWRRAWADRGAKMKSSPV